MGFFKKKQKSENGDIYEGELLNGRPNGKGKMTYTDFYPEDLCEGGNISGYTLADGYVYEGDFVNGKMHGIGKKTYQSGKVEEGRWVNGIFVGAN
jgi:hypothetical protein